MTDSRKPPLIIKGDVSTIRRYGAKDMLNADKWEQKHSDLLAQFMDVVTCLQHSSWRKVKMKVGITSPKDSELPNQEQLVYVAVYFRQLFNNDNLANLVKNTYIQFSSSDIRKNWFSEEYKAATSVWESPPVFAEIVSQHAKSQPSELPKLRELFAAFMYGAHVLHSVGSRSDKNYERISELLRCYERNSLLGLLHGGLASLLNHLSNMALVIDQDFRFWFHEHGLVPPNVYWKNQTLNPE